MGTYVRIDMLSLFHSARNARFEYRVTNWDVFSAEEFKRTKIQYSLDCRGQKSDLAGPKQKLLHGAGITGNIHNIGMVILSLCDCRLSYSTN